MTDYHTKTFYGQKSSITLTSPSKSAPYVFLSCINRKEDRALLITLDSDKEFWIPKSTIHNNYDAKNKKKQQNLIVDKWIIEKQRIIK